MMNRIKLCLLQGLIGGLLCYSMTTLGITSIPLDKVKVNWSDPITHIAVEDIKNYKVTFDITNISNANPLVVQWTLSRTDNNTTLCTGKNSLPSFSAMTNTCNVPLIKEDNSLRISVCRYGTLVAECYFSDSRNIRRLLTPKFMEITNAASLGKTSLNIGYLNTIKHNEKINIDGLVNFNGGLTVNYALLDKGSNINNPSPTILCKGTMGYKGEASGSVSCNNLTFSPGVHNLTFATCHYAGYGMGKCVTNSNHLSFTSIIDPKSYLTTNASVTTTLTNWNTRKLNGPLAQNRLYNNTTNKKIGAYYTEWSVYDRKYFPKNIPVENLTHLYYSFINTNNSYNLTIADTWSALQLGLDPQDSLSIPNVPNSERLKGTYAEMYRMKSVFPHIKIMAALGGYNGSDIFFPLSSDINSIKIFRKNIVNFLNRYDFYDGIDIDWEFPVTGGLHPNLASPEDKQNFVTLAREVRLALDELGALKNRYYELHIAIGPNKSHIDGIDFTGLNPYIDHFNYMSYDYYGAWNSTYGHHTGLYESQKGAPRGANLYTDSGVNYMISTLGLPAHKLSIGVAMYGRAWQNINNPTNDTDPLNGNMNKGAGLSPKPSEFRWEIGAVDYRGIEQFMLGGPNGTGINNYQLLWDENAKANYVWNPVSNIFVTMDTAQSATAKANYINQNNLGGSFSWEISGDSGTLLNSIHEGLGHTSE